MLLDSIHLERSEPIEIPISTNTLLAAQPSSLKTLELKHVETQNQNINNKSINETVEAPNINTQINNSTNTAVDVRPPSFYDFGSFGQDAYFIASDDGIQCIGVADGVGGWRANGVDRSNKITQNHSPLYPSIY
jgi:hypothetical protein